MAAGAVAAGIALGGSPGRDVCAALAVSVVRRKAGVAGERARAERVAARLPSRSGDENRPGTSFSVPRTEGGREFPPALDLIAPIIGAIGLVFAGVHSGGNHDA